MQSSFVEVKFGQCMVYTNVEQPYHCQLALHRNLFLFGIWKNLFRLTAPSFFCFALHPYAWHSVILVMVDVYKQHKSRRCVTITHYAPPVMLRLVDSLRHNHAFDHGTSREFLINWATMAVPIFSKTLRCEDSFK